MNDAITKNTEKKRRRLAIVFVGLSPITTYNERTDIVSQKFYGVAVFLHNTAKGKEGSGAFFSQ